MQFDFLPRVFHSTEQTDHCIIRSISGKVNHHGTEHYLPGIKEITLGPDAIYTGGIDEHTCIALLPLVGDTFITYQGTQHLATPGEIHVADNIESVINTSDPTVLFLELAIPGNLESGNSAKHKVLTFDIDTVNTLHRIQLGGPAVTITIGKFLGKKDFIYTLNQTSTLMVYIISGVFEVSHRLMEAGELLIISDAAQHGEIEIESLAVESILLILEQKQGVFIPK